MSNSRPKSRICASSLLKHLRNIRCFASVPSRNYHLSRKLIITGRLINGPCAPGTLTAIKKEQGSIPASLNPENRCSNIPVTTNLLSLFAMSNIQLFLFPFLMHLVPFLAVCTKCTNLSRMCKRQHLDSLALNSYIRRIPIPIQIHILLQ